MCLPFFRSVPNHEIFLNRIFELLGLASGSFTEDCTLEPALRMNRRRFLTSATQASLAATLTAATAHAQTTSDTTSSQELHAQLPQALVGTEAEAGYFTEARMHEALGTGDLKK